VGRITTYGIAIHSIAQKFFGAAFYKKVQKEKRKGKTKTYK
jgi:hypothetical protein